MKLATEFSLSEFFDTQQIAAYYELTKPGITLTVLASMVIGFVLGSAGQIDYITLIHAILGTWLIASGTAAHNQFLEWRYDGKMKRTKKRPVPASKISPKKSVLFSLTLITVGLLYLLLAVNAIAGLVSLLTTLIYLGIYTPMKRISVANVFIGAIPGALPPVGGWAAATGHLGSTGMWLLFGIVFLWQIPHVMAIAWVCKDDYTNAGFQMLPKNDPAGIKATILIVGCLVALLPVSYGLYHIGMNSWIYLIGGLLSGIVFLYYGLIFAKDRDKPSAKKLMFASFGYLPVIWAFVIVDILIL
ncbi:protoheme IX farnesyltransferase [Aliifodinibius salipaludis]|uniref:Protoheme IX farnesyltransferase n=1 Tax=Fodinibius salipaludis TaxID=2032627 RepID=A0A2A2G9E4_9BACT|nr:heme o synthase [Aliifodinibius salipaludis]PAU93463.1 protoheme IX farnesyltransferase [Aliifodinibius salipaludis]